MRILTRDNYKRIYDIACTTWQPKLQDMFGCKFAISDQIEIDDRIYKTMRDACTSEQHVLFDEIFGKDEKEIEVGKVYKGKLENTLVLITKVDVGSYYGYGFNCDGDWTDECFGNWGTIKNDINCKATQEEWQEALIKEAKRRGFKEGNFLCLVDNVKEKVDSIENWHYEIEENRLYSMPDGKGGAVVFENGKWAEIIKEETTYKRGQRFKFITDKYIIARVGNSNANKLAMINLNTGNLKCKSYTVKNAQIITKNEIKLLANESDFKLIE